MVNSACVEVGGIVFLPNPVVKGVAKIFGEAVGPTGRDVASATENDVGDVVEPKGVVDTVTNPFLWVGVNVTWQPQGR